MDYIIIGIIIGASLIISMIITKVEIPVLKKKAGQNIREEGPKAHLSKAGTPSMGGIAIIAAASAVSAAASFLAGGSKTDMAIIIFVFIGFGLIGFFDDYLKVIKKNNLGLRAYQKFGLQIVISVILAVYLANYSQGSTLVYIPVADMYLDFGVWYIPFTVFVVLAMTNAVNLTDGLDGLASGVTALVSLFFAVAGLTYGLLSGAYFCAAMCGACLGFLVFNKNPAKVFMGDTGSLALGGGLAAAAIVMKLELMLIIAGLVYVIEALSVILQVIYFKATGGRRLFRMAPIHHHFEMAGFSETKVVAAFWIFTVICCAAGLAII
ncbi:MAG TPA: phospho-N-acetylmuramoyl-pentapeptide-transferase [Candidatus Copromorpha excrementigallinarum]|uniref:Phospho-N-acetylmuramoyl-pentapeptide-transferase n=1 Tax=Candidatus Allocopromorpha excrementigallinarum TaxID=2840742 RepID=A0A9D1I008_9FIRM|nr:phospho-N-acetylmuramoyl-pentapeptide-transferase [Candidatus Copromorpha excrementigallinarum]